MNAKKTVLIVIIILVLIVIGYLIYSELKPIKTGNFEVLKDYIGLYFYSSRINFPLQLVANSTG